MMTAIDPSAALAELDMVVGDKIGVSPWVTIEQKDIDDFGRVTRDWDPMHVDPAWCAESGPFPTTVSFGFLTMSFITHMSHEARPWPDGVYALNYGFDRLRFIAPVPVGSRIRGHFSLVAAEGRTDGSVKTVTDVTIEIEGHEKPALTGQWLGVFYPPSTQRKLVA
jgi:acyl dehydratase